MQKKLKVAIIIVLVVNILLLFVFPPIIKSYVQNHYPVKIVSVLIGPDGVDFVGVTTTHKTGIIKRANLRRVTVKFFGPIVVNGGYIEATISPDKEPTVGNGTPRQVTVEDISARVFVGNNSVLLDGVNYSNNRLTFKTAEVIFDKASILAEGGSIDKNTMFCSAEKISIYGLHLDPRIGFSDILSLNRVSLSVRDRTALIGYFNFGSISGKKALVSVGELIAFAVEDLTVSHKYIYSEPATFHGVIAKLDLNAWHAMISANDVLVDITKDEILAAGECNDWAKNMPLPRPKAINESIGSFSGALSFGLKLKPEVKLSYNSTCSFKCSESPIKELSRPDFSYMVYSGDKLLERHISDGWVNYEDISPSVAQAVVSLEDRSFYTHKGVVPISLQMSLDDNLKAGKFIRGGSTLTMQLAKNLWLSRDKNILRKSQEILLTYALESCLTKDQIMEMYLNAVEFAPNVYGIGAGARYYFDKEPTDLTDDEAFYLAMILPHPGKVVKPKDGGLERAARLRKNINKPDMVNLEFFE